VSQAVAVTNTPPTSVGDTTPADIGLDYSDVEFEAADGVMLSGWYLPSSNGAAVVLLHGAGSTRSSVLDHAAVLARHGYGVVLFDARGHGRSGGRAMDFGWYGDHDTSAAVTFLQSQPDVDHERIAAVGMSMGGEEAIGAAAADARIRAVVAEGATNRVAADKQWLSDQYGWRGAVQEGIDWLTYSIADLLTDAEPPMSLHDAVAVAAPRPVLLIASEEVQSEVHAGHYIAGASPQAVDVWVVPDAGHTGALDAHPLEWQQRVTAFLDHALEVDRTAPS
jgi:pimeloyl-ACP methyl ester carboxylesterase